jgi:hypothetical protein
VYEVSKTGGVQTQMAIMEKKLDMIMKAMANHSIALVQQVAQVEVCAIFSHSNHTTKTCPMSSIAGQEQVNFVG